MVKIIEAEVGHMALVRDLFIAYARSLEFDLGFQNFNEELDALPGIYARPEGCVLLAYCDSDLAGCVALKALQEQTGEMKRLYVRPKFQGRGIGRILASEVLERAVEIGYSKIRLDTVPSMTAAIHMYRSLGFYLIPIQGESRPWCMLFRETS